MKKVEAKKEEATKAPAHAEKNIDKEIENRKKMLKEAEDAAAK